MASFGEAIISFVGDFAGLNREGQAEGEKVGQQAGKGMSSGFGTVIKGAAAAWTGMALTRFAQDALKAGQDLSAGLSRSTAIFGQDAQAVQGWAKNAVSSMGISNAAALGYANTLGNTLVNSMGMSTKEAASLSQQSVGTAADLAAFARVPMDQAMGAVTKAMMGQTRGLKQLGISIDNTTVSQKAMEMGLADADGTISQAARAQATYALITEKSTSAQGYAQKALGTYAGQQRQVQAAATDAKAAIGTAMLPILARVGSVVSGVIVPALQKFGNFLSNNKTAATVIAGVLAALVVVASLLGAAVTAVSAALTVWTAVTKIAAAGQAILNAIMAANPIVLIVLAIIALIAVIVILYLKFKPFRDLVNGIWAALRGFASGVISFFAGIPGFVGGVFSAIGSFFSRLWSTVTGFLSNVLSSVGSWVAGVVAWFVGLQARALGAVVSLVTAVLSWILNLRTQATAFVAGLVSGVISWFLNMQAQAAAAVSGLVSRVVGFLANLLGQVIGLAGRIGSAISGGFQAAVRVVAGVIANIAASVVNGLTGLVGEAGRIAANVVSTMASGLQAMVGKAGEIASAMIQGLVSGIVNGAGAITSALQNLASNALNAAKSALGIGSPSRMFAEIGVDVVRGFIVGLEQQEPQLQSALTGLVTAPLAIDLPSPASPGAGAGAGGLFEGATLQFYDEADVEVLSRKMAFAGAAGRF